MVLPVVHFDSDYEVLYWLYTIALYSAVVITVHIYIYIYICSMQKCIKMREFSFRSDNFYFRLLALDLIYVCSHAFSTVWYTCQVEIYVHRILFIFDLQNRIK